MATLTQAQVHHFHLFGFTVVRAFFSPDEVRHLESELEIALDDSKFKHPFDGTRRRFTPTMGSETPMLASLLEDPRLCGAAEALFGPDVLGVATDAHRHVGDTRWHADTNSIHSYGMKAAIYLEPLDPDTGALRILPGSHQAPMHYALKRTLPLMSPRVEDLPGQAIASRPGDVILFDLRAWHASVGGSRDRRACTAIYFNNPKTDDEMAAARVDAKTPFHPYNNSFYDTFWRANPRASDKRRRWLRRLEELGFFETTPAASS